MSLETITIEAHRTAPNLEEVRYMPVEERKRVLLEESNRLDTVLELQSQEREILIVEKQVALRLMDHEEVKENLRKAKFADEQQETKAKASIIKKFIQNHGKKTALIAGGAVILSAAAIQLSKEHKTTSTENSTPKKETPKNKLEALIDEEPRIEEIVSKIDRPFFNKLDTAGQVIYLSQIADTAERRKHPGAWMMVDKNEAKLYVIGEDGKLLKEISVLLGQVIGNEENRVTSTKNPGEFGTTPGGGYRAGEEGITESD